MFPPGASPYFSSLQATVEKVLKTLTVDSKDVRKGEWTNKEASFFPSFQLRFCDEQEQVLDNPAR